MFDNVEKVFKEIKSVILSSSEVKKLLVYTTPDALLRSEPSYEEAEKHIKLKPVLYLVEEAENEVNNFITIGMIESTILNGMTSSIFKIIIASDTRNWLLENEGIRPLKILNIVAQLLYNRKGAAAGKFTPYSVKEVYYNNNVVGYTLLVEVSDMQGTTSDEF